MIRLNNRLDFFRKVEIQKDVATYKALFQRNDTNLADVTKSALERLVKHVQLMNGGIRQAIAVEKKHLMADMGIETVPVREVPFKNSNFRSQPRRGARSARSRGRGRGAAKTQ